MQQPRYGMCSQFGNKPCPARRIAGKCHLIRPARLTGCLLRLRLLQLQTVQQCCAEEKCPRASSLACQLSQHLAVWTLWRYAFHRCAGSCCMSAYKCNLGCEAKVRVELPVPAKACCRRTSTASKRLLLHQYARLLSPSALMESSDLSRLPSLTLCCPPAQSCADPVKTIRQNSLSRLKATMSCLNPASPTVKAFGQPYAKYMLRNYDITLRFRHGRL